MCASYVLWTATNGYGSVGYGAPEYAQKGYAQPGNVQPGYGPQGYPATTQPMGPRYERGGTAFVPERRPGGR